MIHNNSADPVLIKKIHLQIWLLRDEIESVITNSLNGDPEEVKKTIALLRSEYNGGSAEDSEEEEPAPDNVLDLPTAANEEETEEEETEENTEENQELETPEEEAAEDNQEAPEESPEAIEGEATDEAQNEGDVEGESTSEQITAEVETEDAQAPVIEEVKAYTLQDFLPEQNSDGVGINQRRPQLDPAQKLTAMCFLSEVNMDAIYFFCNHKMMAGQSVVIDFLVPQRFLMMAEVVNCRPYNMRSRIISSTPLPYRVAARPLFLKAGERTLLREFLETVEPDLEAIAAQQKAKKSVKKKEEDDDMDDLDDLDL